MILPSSYLLPPPLISSKRPSGSSFQGSSLSQLTKLFSKLLISEANWTKTRSLFKRNEKDLQNLFAILDYDKNGVLSDSDFKSFLMETGFVPTTPELIAFIRRFDRNGDSTIDFEEFVSELTTTPSIKKEEAAEEDDLLEACLKGVFEFFERIGKSWKEVWGKYDFNWREVCEAFDGDRNGRIGWKELKEGMEFFGIDLKEEEGFLLCRRWSPNGNLYLEYEELGRMMGKEGDGEMQETREREKKIFRGVVEKNKVNTFLMLFF